MIDNNFQSLPKNYSPLKNHFNDSSEKLCWNYDLFD